MRAELIKTLEHLRWVLRSLSPEAQVQAICTMEKILLFLLILETHNKQWELKP